MQAWVGVWEGCGVWCECVCVGRSLFGCFSLVAGVLTTFLGKVQVGVESMTMAMTEVCTECVV